MNLNDWFPKARYGLFIHYGLYSMLERGEWVLNREQIPLDEYRALATRFTAEKFDADALCDMAVRAGMRYIVFTTMHHDGFRLYPTQLSSFKSKRDLTGEIVAAARKRGLRIALYHSLNIWTDTPDAVMALEDKAHYERFMAMTFERIKELVTMYNPIDVLWYDGWWPFNAEQWRGVEMNAMVRKIQPHILFNGRNGLPGDFATPEGHLGAPRPWRQWEGCMTLNNSWGFHRGDSAFRTPAQLVDLLATCAQGNGNLLLNVSPLGDGSLLPVYTKTLAKVGTWLKRCGEAIYNTEPFTYDLRERGDHRGDWSHHGPFTIKGNTLYWLLKNYTHGAATFAGLLCNAQKVSVLGHKSIPLTISQTGNRVTISGLPETSPDTLCTVLRIECDKPPIIYLTGGLREPKVPHPHYDPCPSDIAH